MMSVSICMHVWMRLMLFLALNCSYPHHVMFKTCILKKVEVTVTSFIVEIKNYRRLSEWEDTKQSIINFWLNHRMMANIIFYLPGWPKYYTRPYNTDIISLPFIHYLFNNDELFHRFKKYLWKTISNLYFSIYSLNKNLF